jgi:predicted Rossmann-fold nucleotide-binding protein
MEDISMTYKIGVYGSNISEGESAVLLGKELGQALALHHCIVITGACSGMPYVVAHEAKQHGAEVWGFSPELDDAAQKKAYPNDDISIYDRLVYVPQHYKELFIVSFTSQTSDLAARLKYRNVISTANCDAGIVISGGWGTLNEVTNLIYDGKPIGVLTDTGGLADELESWYPKLRKKSATKVLFEQNPEMLVTQLLAIL